MIVISLALIQMFGPSDKLTISFRFVSFHFVPRFYSGYYKLPKWTVSDALNGSDKPVQRASQLEVRTNSAALASQVAIIATCT